MLEAPSPSPPPPPPSRRWTMASSALLENQVLSEYARLSKNLELVSKSRRVLNETRLSSPLVLTQTDSRNSSYSIRPSIEAEEWTS